MCSVMCVENNSGGIRNELNLMKRNNKGENMGNKLNKT